MNQILKNRRQFAYKQLCRQQRQQVINRIRNFEPFETEQPFVNEIEQLLTLMKNGVRDAQIKLGNRLIDNVPDRSQAVRLGLANLPLQGQRGSWLVDICVYPQAPYQMTQFLPHLDNFLGYSNQKVLLRTLSSLQDMVIRNQDLCELIFGLTNFHKLRELIYHQQKQLYTKACSIFITCAATSQHICEKLRGTAFLRDLLHISQCKIAKIRQRAMTGIGYMVQHSPEFLNQLIQSQDGVFQCLFLNGSQDLYEVRREFYFLILSSLKFGNFISFQHIVQNYIFKLLDEGMKTLSVSADYILRYSLQSILQILQILKYRGEQQWFYHFLNKLDHLNILQRVKDIYNDHTDKQIQIISKQILNYIQ